MSGDVENECKLNISMLEEDSVNLLRGDVLVWASWLREDGYTVLPEIMEKEANR